MPLPSKINFKNNHPPPQKSVQPQPVSVLYLRDTIHKARDDVSQTRDLISKARGAIIQARDLISKTRDLISETGDVVSQTIASISEARDLVSEAREPVSEATDLISLLETASLGREMRSLDDSKISVEKIALTQGKMIGPVCRLQAGGVLNVGVVRGGLSARVL